MEFGPEREPETGRAPETVRALPVLPLAGQIVVIVLVVLLTAIHARMGTVSILFVPFCAAPSVLLGLLTGDARWMRLLLLLAIPAAVFAAQDTIPALTAVSFLPPAAIVGFGAGRQWDRLKTTAAGAVALAIWCAAVFGFALLQAGTTPAAWLESFRTETAQALASYSLPNGLGEQVMLFSEESAELLVRVTIMYVPAAVGAVCFLDTWITTVIVRFLLRLLGADRKVFPQGWRMRADRVTAVLFVASQLLAFAFSLSTRTEPLYYAFNNLTVILMLPLAVVGGEALYTGIRTSSRFSAMTRLAAAFLILMVFTASPYLLFFSLALYGVILSFRGAEPAGTGKDGNP